MIQKSQNCVGKIPNAENIQVYISSEIELIKYGSIELFSTLRYFTDSLSENSTKNILNM